jgi:hypothetical protein
MTTIHCIALDDFFKNKKIDFIKSDIQGYDFYAIKGAQQIINKQKRIGIVGEFWPYGLKKAGVSADIYLSLLKKLRLKISLHTPKPFTQLEDTKMYYTDFIAYK